MEDNTAVNVGSSFYGEGSKAVRMINGKFDDEPPTQREIKMTITKKRAKVRRPVKFVNEAAKIIEKISQNNFLNRQFIKRDPQDRQLQVDNICVHLIKL